ncbi:MAG: hypothetical protein ACMUEM_07100 [Flavobacteriales bacterium AspAUS03]
MQKIDIIPPSPYLGLYGDSEKREYKQYLLENNNVEIFSCLFKILNIKL